MVKPKSRKRRRKNKSIVTEAEIERRRAVKATEKNYSIDQILDKAEQCMEQLDFNSARLFCERSLEMNADHPRALETTGNLLLEFSETEKAKQCFGRAITLKPEQGFSKYLNLAQFSEGADAIQLFNKGIELLAKERDLSKEEDIKSYNTKISSAYCSIAEVFLTDLCHDEQAESSCNLAIEKALEYDKDNFEAYQVYSSYLMSANKPDESKNMLHKSMSYWFKPEIDENESKTPEDVDDLPPYPLRLTAAKLLIEHKEYNIALQVIAQLLEEDDEEIQLSFLAGSCYYYLFRTEQEELVLPKSKNNTTEPEDTKSNKQAAADNFSNALRLSVKLRMEDEDLYTNIMDMVKNMGFTEEEPQFNIQCIKKQLQSDAMNMFAMPGSSHDHKETESDEESLTASDKEIINYLDSDSEEEEDNMDTDACGLVPSVSKTNSNNNAKIEEE